MHLCLLILGWSTHSASSTHASRLEDDHHSVDGGFRFPLKKFEEFIQMIFITFAAR